MVTNIEEVNQLEQFFASIEIPKEVYLNPAIRLNDTPTFIKQVFKNLKDPNVSEASVKPRYWDLLALKEILSRK